MFKNHYLVFYFFLIGKYYFTCNCSLLLFEFLIYVLLLFSFREEEDEIRNFFIRIVNLYTPFKQCVPTPIL